ncbi:hypothetical protein F4825DRAFT_113752 [Nemania diffusa]|nr:hypothetical protein F4825DRAFT_113752 [Nemania diffusa]
MPGHGYDGYVNTTISDPAFMKQDSDVQKLTSQLISHTGGDAGRDVNAADPDRDQTTGVFGMASHADRNGKRTGANTLLKRTLADPAKYKLTIQLETLVTRVIINWEDGKPSATGVEVLRGSHQYEVSNQEPNPPPPSTWRVLGERFAFYYCCYCFNLLRALRLLARRQLLTLVRAGRSSL